MKKLEPKSGNLVADNREHVDTWLKAFGKDATFRGILCLVADVLDAAATGRDCYLTIGTNRDKTSLLMTINQDGAKGYLSALEIEELSAVCETYL